MKNSFRNKMFAVTAAAVSSFLLLSGFDSTLTAEDVLEKSRGAWEQAGGFTAAVVADADLSIDVVAGEATQSLPIKGNADYEVQYIAEPFALSVCGNASGDAPAMGMAGGIEMDAYIVEQEDGSGISYIRMPITGDNAWHAATITAEDLSQMKEGLAAAMKGEAPADLNVSGIDLSGIIEQISGDMLLSSEPVSVDGVDCYEISKSIDGETLSGILSQVASSIPQAGLDEASLSAFQTLFSGLKADVFTDCSVEDFVPMYAEIDLSGSDFNTIGQMVGSMMGMGGSEDSTQVPQVNVAVNALRCTVSYYEVPEEITVPEEALMTEVETMISVSDLTGMDSTEPAAE